MESVKKKLLEQKKEIERKITPQETKSVMY